LKGLIVCESFYGNTWKVAEALQEELAESGNITDLLKAKEAEGVEASGYDFLLLGGPTRMFRASPGTRQFVKKLPKSWAGKPFATFCTELKAYRGPHAAVLLAEALIKRGLVQVAEPIITYVMGGKGPLDDDALPQAKKYAKSLAQVLRK